MDRLLTSQFVRNSALMAEQIAAERQIAEGNNNDEMDDSFGFSDNEEEDEEMGLLNAEEMAIATSPPAASFIDGEGEDVVVISDDE